MKFYLKFILCGLFLSFIIGCQNEVNNSISSLCTLSHSEEITFAGNPNMGSSYKIYQFKEISGKPNLIGYSRTRHQLEFWNIQDRVASKVISLGRVGPDAVQEVNGFFYHNPDSIFILNRFNVLIIDHQGTVILSKRINQDNSPVKGIDFSEKIIYIDPDHNSPLFYDDDENCLYFPIKKIGVPQSHDYYKESKICARLNMKTLEAEEMPIPYPFEFTKDFYGMLDKPNITFLDDEIIYNFKINSKIYVFDKHNQEIGVYNFPTEFSSNQVSTTPAGIMHDPNLLVQHIDANPRFLRVHYDKYTDMYYRPHFGPLLESSNRAGERREEFLMAIDGSFKYYTEMRLPPEVDFASMAATPDGLLLYKSDNDEDQVTFQIYRFDCPDENE